MARATGFLFWVMASLLVRAGARVWRDDGTAPGPRGIVPAGCFRATFRPLWRCSKSVARASTAHPGPGLQCVANPGSAVLVRAACAGADQVAVLVSSRFSRGGIGAAAWAWHQRFPAVLVAGGRSAERRGGGRGGE